jgi:hypothetical protein
MSPTFRQSALLASGLLALMVLTRGSHVGSASLLPDATLAVMMLGGMLLQRGFWFAVLMAVAVAIDAFAVGVAGVSSYCLSPAYWALLPTYAVMWVGGVWLHKRGLGFNTLPYVTVALVTTSLAFVLSTHSFYLFSGRFPQASVWEVLQHGWEYFPAYLGYTMVYLSAAWALQQAFGVARSTRSA